MGVRAISTFISYILQAAMIRGMRSLQLSLFSDTSGLSYRGNK